MVPMLAACSPSAAQIWRVKAATEVLPLVPVTATIISGWRGKNFAAVERQRAARIADPDECDASRQRHRGHALGHDRHGTGGQRLADEAQPVVLGARHRHEQIAGLDRAAVGADAGDSSAAKRASQTASG